MNDGFHLVFFALAPDKVNRKLVGKWGSTKIYADNKMSLQMNNQVLPGWLAMGWAGHGLGHN